MNLIITILSTLISFAHADARPDCSAELETPPAYADHFRRYTNPKYLVPLTHGAYQEIGIYREISLYDQSLEEFAEDEPEMLSAVARVKVDSSSVPRTMTFEQFTISDQLDPGYVYRLVLAHLLERMPTVRRIDFDLHMLPDFGPARGRLMTGMSLLGAMAMSDAAHALSDFGFTNIEPQETFIRSQGAPELVLGMRASLPAHQMAPSRAPGEVNAPAKAAFGPTHQSGR